MARGQNSPAVQSRHLPQEQRSMVRHQSVSIQGGPTPPPEHVEAYERLSPGATNRFLVLAEGEAAHRRTHENAHLKVVEENAAHERTLAGRGQTYAFVIAVLAIGGAVFLGFKGAEVTASVIGGGSLVAIIVAFLGGGKKKSDKA
eukprot:TRINITY_DN21936_c0_g2_i1.p2 TRINITY_DN21936_c0_g2~~TRINITY_DN21936_c0_g2_i1.p2  ORF type:complete len:145 (+),score=9.05 TRINITY_DN21936_c0_g2_i1:263-697(+)